MLRLMGNAYTNKAIVETLGITLDTTKKHVQNVISKLEARSRTHAAIIAAQAGIVGSPVTTVVPPLDLEPRERKVRVEDALSATRAAVEEGIVPVGTSR